MNVNFVPKLVFISLITSSIIINQTKVRNVNTTVWAFSVTQFKFVPEEIINVFKLIKMANCFICKQELKENFKEIRAKGVNTLIRCSKERDDDFHVDLVNLKSVNVHSGKYS